MNGYTVRYEGSAGQSLHGIDRSILEAIKKRIEWLGVHAERIRHQPLKGIEFKRHYKLRVGDYRVVYLISHSNKTVTIREIGHRSKIYKER